MERKQVFRLAVAGLLGLSVWVVPCAARLVTVAFTAEVTEVWDWTAFLQDKVKVGDTLTGTYTYDTAVPDSRDYVIGSYEFSSPPCGMVWEVGGCTFRTDPNNLEFKVKVYNDWDAHVSFIDKLILLSERNLPVDGDIEITRIELLLEDEYAFAARPNDPYHPMIGLLSTALPVMAPDLRHWPVRELTIRGYRAPLSFRIMAQVNSATLVCAPPQVIFVDASAAAGGDGSSWDSAYRYLQDALATAGAGEKPAEIRVAQGLYRPDQGANRVPGDRAAAFILLDEVTLSGGYTGLGSADPNARDPQLHETVLTGDLLDDDLPGFRNRRDNSYHVVVALNTDESAVLDGFVITSGSADSLLEEAESPLVGLAGMDGHTIHGGGLYVDGGSLTVRHCMFRGNYAYAYGGGAYLAGLPTRIQECTFVGNTADGGGGMHVDADAVLLQGCLFQGNSASRGGAMIRRGGGCPGIDYLVNCTVADNRAFEGSPIDNTDPNWVHGACLHLYNSIMWDTKYWVKYPGDATVYSNIYGLADPRDEGNIQIDPCFVAPGYWADPNNLGIEVDPNDPKAVWIEGDYHLKSQAGHWDTASRSWVLDEVTSPCIDAGDPASLVDDEPAPNGARINMGAYGGTAEASKSYADEPFPETDVASENNNPGG